MNNKKSIGVVVTAIIGLLMGFFGVMVSVLSDAGIYERIITILIILIIYGILSLALGFLYPVKTWIYILPLSVPGVLLLILYSIKEFKVLYLVYILLILAMTYFGTKSGKSLKRKK